jgi:hypothetical protein
MRFTFVALLASLGAVHGVVISSGDGSGNTSAPGDDPGFNNVGTLGGASAIYIGNQWVLTANHVGRSTVPFGSSVNLGGMSFAVQAGSDRRIENPLGSGLSQYTDLIMYRLMSDPGLPALEIGTGAPTIGTDVVMIGQGRNRAVSPTSWDVTVNPTGADTWVETTGLLPDVNGWKAVGAKEIRWGENDVTGPITVDLGSIDGDVLSFYTTFSELGKTHEAQGTNGDSGGAVFYMEGGLWKLGGVMNAVGSSLIYDGNAPGESSSNPYPYFGRVTTAADLSEYRSQIEAIRLVPEPSSLMLVVLALPLFSRRRRS